MDVEERGSSRKEIGGSTQEEVPEPGGDGGHSAATVQRRLNVQMKTMGPSSPALLSFLSNPEARRHLLTISAPESITLSAQQLQAVQGSVFGSLRNKLASQPTTAALQELPRAIVLELPGNPPPSLQYSLQPRASHRLQLHGREFSYRLIGLIMYQLDVHFVADVYDPCEARWLRFDGMEAGGRATPIEPTEGRMTHRGGRYFPVLAVYVCEQQPSGQAPQPVAMARC